LLAAQGMGEPLATCYINTFSMKRPELQTITVTLPTTERDRQEQYLHFLINIHHKALYLDAGSFSPTPPDPQDNLKRKGEAIQ
jgi:hypothetical protein